MAGEWVGHNIRVNSISPGIMNTRLSSGPSQAGLRKSWLERSPMGLGDPEDLTGAVILLCSDAGKFITGSDIKIDGKYPRWNDRLRLTFIQADTRCSRHGAVTRMRGAWIGPAAIPRSRKHGTMTLHRDHFVESDYCAKSRKLH